jgi:hypothetical protein
MDVGIGGIDKEIEPITEYLDSSMVKLTALDPYEGSRFKIIYKI